MSSRICRPAAISSGLRSFGTVSETRIVSPMPRLIKLLERDSGLDHAVGWKAGLGDPQMERHVGASLRRSGD